MNKHNGEKPFPCIYCSYRARRKSNLRQHYKHKHKLHDVVNCDDIVSGTSTISSEHCNDNKNDESKSSEMEDLVERSALSKALFYNSNRGKPVMAFRGFEYLKMTDKHVWRCRLSQKLNCRARAYQRNKDILVEGEHCHDGEDMNSIQKSNLVGHQHKPHDVEIKEVDFQEEREEDEDEVESKGTGLIHSNLPSEIMPKKTSTFEVHENMEGNGMSGGTELSHGDVMQVLEDLFLTSVKLGDYLVVMSAIEDATIGGEPYIALQLWLNMKLGKVITRIWGRTVARATVTNIDHFKNVCSKHFCDPPCLGCPFQEDELAQKMQGFVISQTPVPRKISLGCQKVLVNDRRADLQACKNCLKLMPHEKWEMETVNCQDKHINVKLKNEEHQQELVSSQEHDKGLTCHKGKDLICSICATYATYPLHIPKTFPKSGYLKRHWKKFHPDVKLPKYIEEKKSLREIGPLDVECELCGAIRTCGSFIDHMQRIHGATGGFKRNCFWCGNSLSVHHLRTHARKYHFWGRFSCKESECSYKGNFATDLAGHINDVHKGEGEAECPQCKKGWPVNEIENHYKECVTANFKKLGVINECCDTCGKIFTHKKKLQEHKLIHLREQAAKGGDFIDQANLYHHCDKCSKRFTQKGALRTHFRQVHDESSKDPCPSCGLVFDTKQKLLEHERVAHSTDESYQCKDCGKRFGNHYTLKIHKRVHEVRQFQCKYCPKKLRTANNLKFHERYHTGEKPFMCSICGNGYVSKNLLNQHRSGAHKIAGPKGRAPGWKSSKK